MDKKVVIPHKIHYCWFGGGKKSPLMEDCIKSWKRFFPDYEIIEWNESNFDVNENQYCKEAYEAKKWAFVSDYARLALIYRYGGIYFDTDVEVIKNFDHILKDGGYLAFESVVDEAGKHNVATGLGFAAEPENEVIKEMLDDYEKIHFMNDGEMDLTACPERNTKVLEKRGLRRDDTCQKIGTLRIYPAEYFCGIDIMNSHPLITKNTYTVHHYLATWKEKPSLKQRIKYDHVIPFIQKIIGYDRYDALKRFLKKS